jgi:hypothetical protein
MIVVTLSLNFMNYTVASLAHVFHLQPSLGLCFLPSFLPSVSFPSRVPRVCVFGGLGRTRCLLVLILNMNPEQKRMVLVASGVRDRRQNIKCVWVWVCWLRGRTCTAVPALALGASALVALVASGVRDRRQKI